MKLFTAALASALVIGGAGYLDVAVAKTKPQTPQGNSASNNANSNPTKKPGSGCDKTKQATEDYKACIDAAAKGTQNKGKTKKQGN
jgi:hypothetical protein